MALLQLDATTYPPKSPSLLPDPLRSAATTPTIISFQRPKDVDQPICRSLFTNYTSLSSLNAPPTSTSYASTLDSCTSKTSGKSVHGHALKSGYHGHEFIETKLLQMYSRCGCLYDAYLLFDKMPRRNLYSWVAIISAHVDHSLYEEAYTLFLELLHEEDIRLDFFVFPVVLKTCTGLMDVDIGKQIHGVVVKGGFISNVYVGNALIDMYGKCKKLDDAKKLFAVMRERDRVSWNSVLQACALSGMVYEALENLNKMLRFEDMKPNIVSWTTVINGFAQNGFAIEAVKLLFVMQTAGYNPNAQTLASVLPAYASLQSLSLGKEIHGYITRHGFISCTILVNGLLDVYRKCSDMESALQIFEKLSAKNTVSLNTMIVGYCERGDVSGAKELFDKIEYNGMKRDRITWNTMISGYVDNHLYREALVLFLEMKMVEGTEADSYTFGSIFSACAAMGCLALGKQIHGQVVTKGFVPYVGGALVEMYCKCQDLEAAHLSFNEVMGKDIAAWNALVLGFARCNRLDDMHDLLSRMREFGFEPNVYTWNGLISGLVENGKYNRALKLFVKMQTEKIRPDIYTIGIILPACSRMAMMGQGKQAHAYAIRCGYESEVYIGAALVDMYAKCGNIRHAELTSCRISRPNLVSQNAMLTAYATHGYGAKGIALFYHMLENGITPDEITFLSVLCSCVHAGELELGLRIFDMMSNFNVVPSLKHYTSMVDLLSRSGRTREAYELLKNMPVKRDAVTWGALLAGCVSQGDVELGEIAAKELIELEPNDTGNFILLANLYAHAGRWHDLARTRKMMEEKRMVKSPGCSWIEDGGDVHVFVAGDRSHQRTKEICDMLENLAAHMKKWNETPTVR